MGKVAVLFERSNTMVRAFRKIGIEAFSYDIYPDYTGCSRYHVIRDLSNLAALSDLSELRDLAALGDLSELRDLAALGDLSELRDLVALGDLSELRDLAALDELIDLVQELQGYDLIVAHPPCTYLSSVGASRLFNKDGTIKNHDRELMGFRAAKLVRGILKFPCDKIVLENPAPMTYFGLPPYSQVIQPYQFGDPYTKRTCLWLKGLPLLKPTKIVIPQKSWVSVNRSSTLRSKTFEGIANAIAYQYGKLL